MTLTVHHLQVSQSERVVWLCEELGIDYELKNYARDPLLAPPDYAALHPIGAAPVIEDNGKVIAESGACVEYIAHRYGNGRFFPKPEDEDYPDFLYWWHASNATIQTGVMRMLVLQMAGIAADNPASQMFAARFEKSVAFMDSRLSSAKWLGGDEFTAADIMPLFTLTTMRQFWPMDFAKFPNLLRWMQACTARPAYQRAMAKSDPTIDVKGQVQAESPPPFPPLAAAQAQK